MIRQAKVIFCDSEHGTGDVCFPDLTNFDRAEIQQVLIDSLDVGALRRRAKAAGWGRFQGGDYCPGCMASLAELEGGR